MTEKKTYICDLTSKSYEERESVMPFEVLLPSKEGFKKIGGGHVSVDVVPDEYLEYFTNFGSVSKINVLVSGDIERHALNDAAIGGLMGIVLIDDIQRQVEVSAISSWEMLQNEEFHDLLDVFITENFVHRDDVEEAKIRGDGFEA